MKKKDMTFMEACYLYGVDYREGVTRMIDLAKVVGANYQDGYTLEQILEQAGEPKVSEESVEGNELKIEADEVSFVDISKLEKPQEHLKTARTALNGLKLKWFLAFGTALGLYRDKDFIEKDTDIDIAIIDENPDIEAIKVAFKEYKVIRTAKDDNKTYQVCFQAEDKMVIDIQFFYEDKDTYFTRAGGGQYIDDKKVIGELKNIRTKYGIYPFPEKIEEYLEGRYSDWKIPVLDKPGSSKKINECG